MKKTERLAILNPLRKANIRAEVTVRPIVRSRDDDRRSDLVVQMDIADRGTNFETLRLWPGADGNEIHISGTDRRLRQAVLSIREPERTFRIHETMTQFALKETLRRSGTAGTKVKIISSQDRKYDMVEALLEMTTPDARRHFLVGKDERFYFIANCPSSPVTVRDAHVALRPKGAEREGTERQGEWFFVPFTPREADAMEELLRKAPIHHEVALYDMRENPRERTRNRRAVPRTVHPFPQGDHIAENLYVDARENLQLAQGYISHRRHRKLMLRNWHKVEHNLEIENPLSVRWVD